MTIPRWDEAKMIKNITIYGAGAIGAFTLVLALGAAAGATAGSVAARGNVAPPQALGRLAKLFTVILLLINVPLAFMGGFGSWLITALAVGVLWLPLFFTLPIFFFFDFAFVVFCFAFGECDFAFHQMAFPVHRGANTGVTFLLHGGKNIR